MGVASRHTILMRWYEEFWGSQKAASSMQPPARTAQTRRSHWRSPAFPAAHKVPSGCSFITPSSFLFANELSVTFQPPSVIVQPPPVPSNLLRPRPNRRRLPPENDCVSPNFSIFFESGSTLVRICNGTSVNAQVRAAPGAGHVAPLRVCAASGPTVEASVGDGHAALGHTGVEQVSGRGTSQQPSSPRDWYAPLISTRGGGGGVTLSFPISIGRLDIELLLCVYWLDKAVVLVHCCGIEITAKRGC